MLWAGIINELVGPIKVRDGVKINAASYCDLLDEVLVLWLDKQTLALCKKLVFMQDNAPAHSARVTKQYLADLGINPFGTSGTYVSRCCTALQERAISIPNLSLSCLVSTFWKHYCMLD